MLNMDVAARIMKGTGAKEKVIAAVGLAIAKNREEISYIDEANALFTLIKEVDIAQYGDFATVNKRVDVAKSKLRARWLLAGEGWTEEHPALDAVLALAEAASMQRKHRYAAHIEMVFAVQFALEAGVQPWEVCHEHFPRPHGMREKLTVDGWSRSYVGEYNTL